MFLNILANFVSFQSTEPYKSLNWLRYYLISPPTLSIIFTPKASENWPTVSHVWRDWWSWPRRAWRFLSAANATIPSPNNPWKQGQIQSKSHTMGLKPCEQSLLLEPSFPLVIGGSRDQNQTLDQLLVSPKLHNGYP